MTPHLRSSAISADSKLSKSVDFTFDALVAEAQGCQRCESMIARTAVLSRLNGNLTPKALLVAEAPGRQGADRTRIPFHGDASGVAFARLLTAAGLVREDLFITNAVLCSPRSESGANRSPKASEIRNCNDFLARTIDTLNPPLVIAVGATALSALGRIEAHGLTLSENVGQAVKWRGRYLAPAYHPSPQVLISRRSLEQQEADWVGLGELIRKGGLH
jgi:DNA polymerase